MPSLAFMKPVLRPTETVTFTMARINTSEKDHGQRRFLTKSMTLSISIDSVMFKISLLLIDYFSTRKLSIWKVLSQPPAITTPPEGIGLGLVSV